MNIRLLLWSIVCIRLVSAPWPDTHAQGVAKESLNALFDLAVSAEGPMYRSIRTNIVARNEAATIHFLNEQAKTTNVQRRVTARALLSWLQEPDTNYKRSDILASRLADASRKRAGMLTMVQRMAFGELVPFEEPIQPDDELHRSAAVAFLLEAAMKGSADIQNRAAVRDYELWARCFTAALVGGYNDPDVIPVLVDLLENERFEIRACAATGLRRTKNVHAIEALINALADTEAEVRRSAYLGLQDLTGRDFRHDPRRVVQGKDIDEGVRKQFQEWWQQNKERLLNVPER